MIKRRSFLQGIAAAIFGGGVALKAKKDAGLEHLEGEPVEILEAGAEQEYELGARKETGFGYNRKVFRYVQHQESPGSLRQYHGIKGVTKENGWLQTYGVCGVTMEGYDVQIEADVDLER